MLVDDNRDAARNLAILLEHYGHTVTVAHDAKQAVEFAHINEFKVFLLDIGLPDVDGYKLAHELREMRYASATTFIAVSGYGMREDKDRSKAAHFHHHFIKPVKITELLGVLSQIATAR